MTVDHLAKSIVAFVSEVSAFTEQMDKVDIDPARVHSTDPAETLSAILDSLAGLSARFDASDEGFSRLGDSEKVRQIADSIRRSLARLYIECSTRKELTDDKLRLISGNFSANKRKNLAEVADSAGNCNQAISNELGKLTKLADQIRSVPPA